MQKEHYIMNEKYRPSTLDGYVCEDSFKQKIEVGLKFYEPLNQQLIILEQNRTPEDEKYRHKVAEEKLKEICEKMQLILPEINGLDKYDFSNDIQKK
jgi:hypothetical protein